MLYQLHEYNRALLGPVAELARAGAYMFSAPESWFAHLPGANRVAAGYELLYRLGKEYEKPAWGIEEVALARAGAKAQVVEHMVLAKPFCRLMHFERRSDDASVTAELKREPVVLVVAPLSGHHATLLRDTVRTLLSAHDVYATTRSTSPTGSTRAWCRWPKARSRWTPTWVTCASSCATSARNACT